MQIEQQYQWVLESRELLFEYCQTISSADFKNQNTSFGRGGSMCSLLVHTANTYQFWIGEVALKKKVLFADAEKIQNTTQVQELFENSNQLMTEFFNISQPEIIFEVDGTPKRFATLQLFTHVMTHEYHHKGQILALSRHLGYVPVDTDVIR